MKPATFERSHGVLGARRAGRRELKAAPRSATHEPKGAGKRPARAAKRSMFAKAAAMATQAGVSSPDAADLARLALRLFRAGRRELGADALTAQVYLFSWALQAAVAQQLTLRAAEVGLDTDAGAALLARGGMAQGRAERAWNAAACAAGLLGGPPARSAPPRAPWLEPDDGDAA